MAYARALSWAQSLLAAARPGTKTTTGGGRGSGEPVEVYTAANDLEAQVVKGFLESNDIPVMLRRESMGTVLSVAVGQLAEVGVMVPEALAGRAQELLEAQVELASDLDEDADLEAGDGSA